MHVHANVFYFSMHCQLVNNGRSFIHCKKSGYMLLHPEQIQCVLTERFDSLPTAFHL